MKKIHLFFTLLLAVCTITITACNNDNEASSPTQPTPEIYAKGADISWVTQMESDNCVFKNFDGSRMECTALMKVLGMNAIRLRVWVNPQDGWCGKEDVLVKARRAHQLGMRLMIDFHYSDSWADPGKQYMPAAWAGFTLSQLREAIAAHTADVLGALKAENINVEWVQVGNEVSYGMLWDKGKLDNKSKYADFVSLTNAGYDAVKKIYPSAKVILHIDKGQDAGLYKWFFGEVAGANGAKYNAIGMSLYPSSVKSGMTRAEMQKVCDDCIANIKTVNSSYKKPVILCEVGMPQDNAGGNSRYIIEYLLTQTQTLGYDICQGIFYWEPECYYSGHNREYDGYWGGAFNNDGTPTDTMRAFSK